MTFKCSSSILALLILAPCAGRGGEADVPTMGLRAVLRKVEASDPRVRAAQFQAEAANQNIAVQRSAYFPNVSIALISSTGNDGSFAMFDVDSDFSSSQRIGSGGGLILKQNVWDFGRTGGAVEIASREHAVEETRGSVVQLETELRVMRTYLSCAFLSSQIESAKFMADQTAVLAKETNKFVRSGQRSIVERYLVDAEAQEAQTRIAEYSSRLQSTEERLATEFGSETKVKCADLKAVQLELEAVGEERRSNPLIELQKLKLRVAEARVEYAKAESRPVVFGMATGGYFENDRLTNKWNYAAGIGIRLPLFEGFRIDSQIDRNLAQLNADRATFDFSRMELERTNSKHLEQVKALSLRIAFLEKEKKLANEVFSIARNRYFRLLGTMADLRDSIRNVNRILVATDEAYRDLYIARGELLLLTGAQLD